MWCRMGLRGILQLRMLPVRCHWPNAVLLSLGTTTRSIVQLKWRNLGFLSVLLFPLAGPADERECLLLSLLGCISMTLAVLPNIAPVACYAVRPIVHVLAMLPTN